MRDQKYQKSAKEGFSSSFANLRALARVCRAEFARRHSAATGAKKSRRTKKQAFSDIEIRTRPPISLPCVKGGAERMRSGGIVKKYAQRMIRYICGIFLSPAWAEFRASSLPAALALSRVRTWMPARAEQIRASGGYGWGARRKGNVSEMREREKKAGRRQNAAAKSGGAFAIPRKTARHHTKNRQERETLLPIFEYIIVKTESTSRRFSFYFFALILSVRAWIRFIGFKSSEMERSLLSASMIYETYLHIFTSVYHGRFIISSGR